MLLSRNFVRTYFFGLATITLMILLSGCWKHEKPNITYMPNMAYSPAIKAQENPSEQVEGKKPGMFVPVEGTVPRDYHPYEYAGDVEQASRSLRNPLTRTRSVLYKGKELFGAYCKVCHGPTGQGNGTIVPKFPMPPSLTSDKVRGYTDGRIFHIITEGQNLMPSYATQIEEEERWAIVHFVRVLNKAVNPSASDQKKAENW